VDRKLQYATGPVRPPLQIHEREPMIAEYGQHGLLDSELAFVVLHRKPQPETKKVGDAHFFETLARVCSGGNTEGVRKGPRAPPATSTCRAPEPGAPSAPGVEPGAP